MRFVLLLLLLLLAAPAFAQYGQPVNCQSQTTTGLYRVYLDPTTRDMVVSSGTDTWLRGNASVSIYSKLSAEGVTTPQTYFLPSGFGRGALITVDRAVKTFCTQNDQCFPCFDIK